MKLILSYSDGQYGTRPVEDGDNVEELVKLGVTIIELTPEQELRYNAFLSESAFWHELFRKADNEAYDIRHNAGFSQEELP